MTIKTIQIEDVPKKGQGHEQPTKSVYESIDDNEAKEVSEL